MSNFWDNISQNNINNYRPQQNMQRPNLLQFIIQNKGKTLNQMLKEYNLTNISEEEINNILPEAKNMLNSLNLKNLKF